MFRIESLLSARLFLTPQVVGDRIYFLSNLSGHISLYVMDYGGSVPEPLLPPNIALQNPHLIDGEAFCVFPKLNKILVMIDRDGDENYQPMQISIEGGFPEGAFNNFFTNYRCHLEVCYPNENLIYINAESRTEQMEETYRGNLETGELVLLGASPWGAYPVAINANHTKAILVEGYSVGDMALYMWEEGQNNPRLLYGVPIEQRTPGQQVPLLGLTKGVFFTSGDHGLLLGTALFCDTYGLSYLDLANPSQVKPVTISGTIHTGIGELETLNQLKNNRYIVGYNIDGCDWLYEGTFDETALLMKLDRVIAGHGMIANGVMEACHYDETGDCLAISYSTATSPTQIYTVEGIERQAILPVKVVCHTREKVLGIPNTWLSSGEDASFTSFDGTRISARLYLPAQDLGFTGPRPIVYYIHGGPHSQERPDFAWFSMPLIQFLTLNGFAVFVPNVRGSSGYGLTYKKRVDRDWGGQDRLDHIHALTHVLPHNPQVDVTRAAVVGRSYGGYMTLTLAARHPDLWKAAADMFGPYDLITFSERIPITWKPYFAIALGDPAIPSARAFLQERSPRTYMDELACPMLVIQGKNDPRVVEQESRDLVKHLQANGKNIEYLMFENEGHDVLKYENRVACYNAITDFFKKYLMP